jgi:hypothetical protein
VEGKAHQSEEKKQNTQTSTNQKESSSWIATLKPPQSQARVSLTHFFPLLQQFILLPSDLIERVEQEAEPAQTPMQNCKNSSAIRLPKRKTNKQLRTEKTQRLFHLSERKRVEPVDMVKLALLVFLLCHLMSKRTLALFHSNLPPSFPTGQSHPVAPHPETETD